jgi:hypothetical protein
VAKVAAIATVAQIGVQAPGKVADYILSGSTDQREGWSCIVGYSAVHPGVRTPTHGHQRGQFIPQQVCRAPLKQIRVELVGEAFNDVSVERVSNYALSLWTSVS